MDKPEAGDEELAKKIAWILEDLGVFIYPPQVDHYHDHQHSKPEEQSTLDIRSSSESTVSDSTPSSPTQPQQENITATGSDSSSPPQIKDEIPSTDSVPDSSVPQLQQDIIINSPSKSTASTAPTLLERITQNIKNFNKDVSADRFAPLSISSILVL